MELDDILIYLGLGLIFGGWCLLAVMIALTGHWVWLTIWLIGTGFVLVGAGAEL